jgi:hypothetical protein
MRKITILLLMIFVSISTPVFGAPTASELANRLRTTPVQEHLSIYRDILADTSVLQSNELREAIIDVARGAWYKRYMKGNEAKKLGIINAYNFKAKPIDFPETKNENPDAWNPKSPRILQKLFSMVVTQMQGRDFVRAALWIKTNPGLDKDKLEKKLIKQGAVTVDVWLDREAYFGSGKKQRIKKRNESKTKKRKSLLIKETTEFCHQLRLLLDLFMKLFDINSITFIQSFSDD